MGSLGAPFILVWTGFRETDPHHKAGSFFENGGYGSLTLVDLG